MLILANLFHSDHNPKNELFHGLKIPHVESPARFDAIMQALKKAGFEVKHHTKSIPFGLLLKIHDKEYIKALGETSKKVTQDKEINRLESYSFDTYTPIIRGTYKAAFEGASLTFQLAEEISEGKEKYGYALTRPPGHHASKAQMGGYCYFNNAAIAAEVFSKKGKVAILDLDFHHGHGTQDIFYHRSDVLYASIHADPLHRFPHIFGFVGEDGTNGAKGFNVNRPLPLGTTNTQYNQAVLEVLEIIKKFKPKYLVVSLGLDTHKDDPIGGFKLTTSNYKKLGQIVKNLNFPTLVVQEGGYNTEVIGDCVVQFLRGLQPL